LIIHKAAGINTSATVGQMQKFAGEVFGGSTLTLNGEVDFSDSSTFTDESVRFS
jgi:hypothetical protein